MRMHAQAKHPGEHEELEIVAIETSKFKVVNGGVQCAYCDRVFKDTVAAQCHTDAKHELEEAKRRHEEKMRHCQFCP